MNIFLKHITDQGCIRKKDKTWTEHKEYKDLISNQNLSKQKNPGPDSFFGELYQAFNE